MMSIQAVAADRAGITFSEVSRLSRPPCCWTKVVRQDGREGLL